jgi:MtfA peptidase
MWSMFTKRRRRKLLSEPLGAREEALLEREVAIYSKLPSAERGKLRDLARVLSAEKSWEGCGGLKLTGDMRLVIAAQAAVLLLGITADPLRDDLFPQSRTILVYPEKFYSSLSKQPGPAGSVIEGSTNLGEAWFNGPVILSWADALSGGRGLTPGHNVVIHEFAHTLDMLDGSVNGTPILDGPDLQEQWAMVMTTEYNRLARSAAMGTPHALSTYGLHSPGEFFAVATEAFFTRSSTVRDMHPELYTALSGYYNLDPATWA